MKKPLPTFLTDEEAERFVDEADLSEFDLSGGRVMHLHVPAPSGHGRVVITLPDADVDAAARRAQLEGVTLEAYLGRLVHDRLEQLA